MSKQLSCVMPILLVLTVAAQADEWKTIEPGGDTLCATGSPYSFHVRQAASDRVMIYFNGGGACWSDQTCDVNGRPSFQPFAEADDNDPRGDDGAFALENPENPFREWSQVFVSYCTGDVHLGSTDTDYSRQDGSSFVIHHRGLINAQSALDYVYENFPDPQRVFVSGGSAGAISSPVFAAMVADHYTDAEIIHLGGGGAGYHLPPPTNLWTKWGVFTGLPDIFDTGKYTAENTTLPDLYRMSAEVFPKIRFHQYDSAFDAIQERFHALLGVPVELLPGLNANRAELQSALPYLRSYTAPGEFHTLLRYSELYERVTGGVRALDWVSAVSQGKEVKNIYCGGEQKCR